MAKDDTKPTITLDADALQALVNAQVAAALAKATPAQPTAPQLSHEEQMRLLRGADRPPPEIRYEECESPLTGSTFRAKVQSSRRTALGIVIDITDSYTFPKGIDVPQSRGGLMPDKFTAAVEAPESDQGSALKTEYEHWKYWDFVRRDMQEFASGRPFTTYLRKSEADARRARDAEAAKGSAT